MIPGPVGRLSGSHEPDNLFATCASEVRQIKDKILRCQPKSVKKTQLEKGL
jgi:hypothetical protein